VGPDAKLAMLERLRMERRLAAEQTLAVGDGANDLPMLLAAGLGVAYHAHAPVARQAPVTIEHADLRALLFLQGIAKRDFVLT
jgi:phosphoserine phosphatase